MPLTASDLKKGTFIVLESAPYVVLSHSHSHIGRGGAVVQTKVRNLKTSATLERNFKSGDSFKEAEIKKVQARFIYERKGEYWFNQVGRAANRFFISTEALGGKAVFLKPDMEVAALKFTRDERVSPGAGRPREEIINIELPIKADYKVIDAPPNIRGSTADGGRKAVVLEGGLKVNTPLFIQEGDTIRINTETGEYAERV